MTLERDLLALLRCPRSGASLQLDDGGLSVAGEPATARYPLAEGIPVLLAQLPEREAIIDHLRTRSATYYRDNYVGAGNVERQRRQKIVLALLRGSIAPGASVLEAGAGPAALGSEILALTERYVASDMSLDNLLEGRRRLGPIDAVVGDLAALPFAPASFDVVVAVGCLEYVRELPVAIGELVRVAAPGATIIATFANAASPRRWWDERVAVPALRLRHRRRAAPEYPRWVQRVDAIEHAFRARGAHVAAVDFYGPALLGFPLAQSDRLQRADEALSARIASLRARRSEFVVRAVVPR